MIGHLIVLTTVVVVGGEVDEYRGQYLVPCHLDRRRRISCCVRLG